MLICHARDLTTSKNLNLQVDAEKAGFEKIYQDP